MPVLGSSFRATESAYMSYNDILRKVEQHWDREVEAGCGYTVPALSLSRELVEDYVAGRLDRLPGVEYMEQRQLLVGVAGKDVLCNASGGGQQSAVFGLLGARVTVLDLCEGQLRGDRAAAQHYGYEVTTVKGQAPSIAWVPDVRPVYREVYRVLRPGGRYCVAHNNPAVQLATWDGTGYRIVDRYRGGPVLRNAAGVENMEEGEPTGDNRHLLKDIFGGLLELGFVIREVAEDSHHLEEPASADPGSWTHMQYFLGVQITIVVEKP
jgi:SAM-dependent methyltransferase